MRAAIEQALFGKESGNYAIGAVVIKGGEMIACSHNRTRSDQDPTQHAEVAVIRQASKALGSRHLTGCILYTTHEPCPMCATACVWARLDGVIIGASIEDMDNYRLLDTPKNFSWRTIPIPAVEIFTKGSPRVPYFEGFMREECKKLFHS